jgi:hypothetical protein
MKVSQAIKYLSEYNPDDEIIIEWWSRDFTEIDDKEIPVDIWNWVADGHEFYEMTMSEMSYEIQEKITEAMEQEKAQ